MNDLESFARTVYLDIKTDIYWENGVTERCVNLMHEAEKLLDFPEELWRQYRMTFCAHLRLLENMLHMDEYVFKDGEIVVAVDYELGDDGRYIFMIAGEGDLIHKVHGNYLEAVEDDEDE